MTAAPLRDELAARIRAALPEAAEVREVGMFGGIAFMVNRRLAVSAGRAGDLLVHVEPTRHAELLEQPGARPAEMGKGRTMGPRWLRVGPDGLETDDQLAAWVAEGLRTGT